jgi:hypothetical protein
MFGPEGMSRAPISLRGAVLGFIGSPVCSRKFIPRAAYRSAWLDSSDPGTGGW